ncbi:hypothetical protein D3C76_1376540 [compost metagenome]
MDHFGMRREGIQFTGHAIVKTRTNGDQQVALLYRQIGGFGAVHPQHAQIVRVIGINRTQPLQRTG